MSIEHKGDDLTLGHARILRHALHTGRCDSAWIERWGANKIAKGMMNTWNTQSHNGRYHQVMNIPESPQSLWWKQRLCCYVGLSTYDGCRKE